MRFASLLTLNTLAIYYWVYLTQIKSTHLNGCFYFALYLGSFRQQLSVLLAVIPEEVDVYNKHNISE